MGEFDNLRGPDVFQNWVLMQRWNDPGPELEYLLYSDAQLAHEWSPVGSPYAVIAVLREVPNVPRTAAAVLRLSHYRNRAALLVFSEEGPEHGGELHDEVVALLSLELGARIKAARSYSRRWGFYDDPKGQPVSHEEPVLVPVGPRTLLPTLGGVRLLSRVELLPTLPSLAPDDASALVVSARLYQEAVWIADIDAEYAWLLLVSAIETAAARWSSYTETPRQRMQTSRPALDTLLVAEGGDSLADRVADLIAPYMGATRKFREFLLSFFPNPPSEQYDPTANISWADRKLVKAALEEIYTLRSRKLHGGTSFPSVLREYVATGGSHAVGYMFRNPDDAEFWSDVPCLLHTFEYVVRHALLRWWHSLPKHSAA